MQLQLKGRITWSCPHRMYLQADLAYEVTRERGYCVTRLRSIAFLAAPPLPHPLSARRKVRGNVIPFPGPRYSARVLSEMGDTQNAVTQLAPQEQRLLQDPTQKSGTPTLEEILIAVANEEKRRAALANGRLKMVSRNPGTAPRVLIPK